MTNRVTINGNKFQDYEGIGGKGNCGQIKKASWYEKSVTINNFTLNKGSLIDYLNTKITDPNQKLSKNWLWGSSNATVIEKFHEIHPSSPTATSSMAPPSSKILKAASQAISAQEVLKIKDMTGDEKEGKLQLSAGSHTIKILHGDNKDKTISITTKHPIYYFSQAKFTGMPNEASCLIMHQTDFTLLTNTIRQGGFGFDYTTINSLKDHVVVWKLPADLKEINNWTPIIKMTKAAVGTYQIKDDTNQFSSTEEPCSTNLINDQDATKYRMDFPKQGTHQPISVHHLELSNKTLVAGFSTGNLFANFNSPTKEEKAKVATLLKSLKTAGINAFTCNGRHHLLVLSQDINSNPITPRDVTNLLKTEPTGSTIKKALQTAANPNMDPAFNADEWAQNFIQVYGE